MGKTRRPPKLPIQQLVILCKPSRLFYLVVDPIPNAVAILALCRFAEPSEHFRKTIR